ncbi:MAG: iron-containing redox enzyme family protein [Acidiferrobacteraceae bacterium]
MPRIEEQLDTVYRTMDPRQIESLRQRHAWITEPLYRASEEVRTMPFFDWIDSLDDPMQFRPAAVQLFHHSATFPKVMGLMLAMTPMSENHMMPFYATHAYGEATHHELLMQWMLKHGLLPDRAAIESVIPTLATNACINLAYQMALEADRYKWVLTINSGIERCSNDFFKAVAPKMHALGVGDAYFDIHVEADEHHSIMGMAHLEPQDPESPRGRHLIAKALEGVALWAAMIHSWIGMDVLPCFARDGSIARGQLRVA